MVHSERRRGKSRSRILYWFRTPPGVRVGRVALDEKVTREIEALNPSIEFDWPRIIKGQGEPRQPRDDRPQQKEEPQKYDAPKHEPPQQEQRQEQKQEEHAARVETVAEAVEPEREIPAHARIGVDGVARLRSRYREIAARVAERVTDPVQREELNARAERLNPDSWVTDQEVVQGLEEYEPTLAALQSVVGRKRRKRRRGRRTAEAPAVSAPPDGGDDEVFQKYEELSGTEDDEGEDEKAPEKPEL